MGKCGQKLRQQFHEGNQCSSVLCEADRLTFDIPPLNDEHIFRLTDDTGIFQHAKYEVPDPSKGYTTDDNCRALIMAVVLYERYKKKKYLDLVYRYLSFVLNAQTPQGRFKNFMNYSREFIEEEGSEDCFGRCLWALGFTLSCDDLPRGVNDTCMYLFKKALPNVDRLKYPRGRAYSILGLSCANGCRGFDLEVQIMKVADSLVEEYRKCSQPDWKWFEEEMTYSNAVLPCALFAAYKETGKREYFEVANESMNFLEELTIKDGYFKPIGCKGWLKRGGKPTLFDEQPIEAWEMILMYSYAYRVKKRDEYLEKIRLCFEWYLGRNSQKMSLIDPKTGGCYDGLTPHGVNLNQGSESLIAYCLSYLLLESVNKNKQDN